MNQEQDPKKGGRKTKRRKQEEKTGMGDRKQQKKMEEETGEDIPGGKGAEGGEEDKGGEGVQGCGVGGRKDGEWGHHQEEEREDGKQGEREEVD